MDFTTVCRLGAVGPGCRSVGRQGTPYGIEPLLYLTQRQQSMSTGYGTWFRWFDVRHVGTAGGQCYQQHNNRKEDVSSHNKMF